MATFKAGGPHRRMAGRIRALAGARSLSASLRRRLGRRGLPAGPEGKKELVGFQAGVRESAQSWRELLVEIKRWGLSIPPRIAVGDGALGFWMGEHQLSKVIAGVRFQDGTAITTVPTHSAA